MGGTGVYVGIGCANGEFFALRSAFDFIYFS